MPARNIKTSLIQETAARHFEKLGRSKKNLFYVKLKYEYKFKGKRRESQFSIPISKLKNTDQLSIHVDELISAFKAKHQTYSRAGFSEIEVTGVVVQGYE